MNSREWERMADNNRRRRLFETRSRLSGVAPIPQGTKGEEDVLHINRLRHELGNIYTKDEHFTTIRYCEITHRKKTCYVENSHLAHDSLQMYTIDRRA